MIDPNQLAQWGTYNKTGLFSKWATYARGGDCAILGIFNNTGEYVAWATEYTLE